MERAKPDGRVATPGLPVGLEGTPSIYRTEGPPKGDAQNSRHSRAKHEGRPDELKERREGLSRGRREVTDPGGMWPGPMILSQVARKRRRTRPRFRRMQTESDGQRPEEPVTISGEPLQGSTEMAPEECVRDRRGCRLQNNHWIIVEEIHSPHRRDLPAQCPA